MGRSMTTGAIRLAAPNWAGRPLDPEFLIPGGAKLDAPSFTSYPTDVVVTLTAAAAAGATALTVAATAAAIPAGVSLNFGIPNLYAITNGVTAAGATVVQVQPLDNAIASGAAATFKGWVGREVAGGVLVSRTIAQRNAGVGFHPAISTDDEFGIVAFDVNDVVSINDVVLVAPFSGFVVKENFLPASYTNSPAGVDSAVMAKLRAGGYFLFTIGQE